MSSFPAMLLCHYSGGTGMGMNKEKETVDFLKSGCPCRVREKVVREARQSS